MVLVAELTNLNTCTDNTLNTNTRANVIQCSVPVVLHVPLGGDAHESDISCGSRLIKINRNVAMFDFSIYYPLRLGYLYINSVVSCKPITLQCLESGEQYFNNMIVETYSYISPGRVVMRNTDT